MTNPKIEYEELTAGYEFTPTDFQLDEERVAAYLQAVGDDTRIYEENKIVPPMAIAALAMAALSTGMVLPDGTIHVSQDLNFNEMANIGEGLTSYAKVNRKVERGKFHILTIGINVTNQKNTKVVTGETSFILPLS
ncbi:MAG: MaoC family dehydratase N-terminal domain-containing protein [Chloroflexota bacterium]